MLPFFAQLLVGSSLLGALSQPPVPLEISLDRWQPQAGDQLVIDTQANEAYLKHADGRFIRFLVGTGQRRTIRYIGRTYFGTTPARDWVLCGSDFKPKGAFFGPTGRFFRLCEITGEETAYGLHGYGYMADLQLKTSQERFVSYGCVLFPEEALDLIEKTIAIGGGEFPVTTRYGETFETQGS